MKKLFRRSLTWLAAALVFGVCLGAVTPPVSASPPAVAVVLTEVALPSLADALSTTPCRIQEDYD